MKKNINEIKRMQQLAGIINENEIPTVYNKPEWAMSPETAEQIKPIQAFLEENGWVIEETGANSRVHYFTAVKNKTPVNITT
jgi:hypothetical protein